MHKRLQFIQLGDWLLDCEQQRIKKDNNWQDVPTLSFKLLITLVGKPNEVIGTDQLIKAVWGEKQVVSDENLQQRVRMLRKLLNDDVTKLEYIGTVRGKGYRLLLEPKWVKNKIKPNISKIPQFNSINFKRVFILFLTLAFIIFFIGSLKLAGYIELNENKVQKSVLNRIAVMPFTQKGALNDFEGLDGELTLQVIESMSDLNDVAVISFQSSQEFKNKKISTKDVGSLLKVEFIVLGNIEFQNDTFYIEFKLIDTDSDQVILAKMIKTPFSKIPDVSQLIISEISTLFSNQYSPKSDTKIPYEEAYRLYLKGQSHYFKYNKIDNQLAESFFRQSLAISPVFPLALCGLSNVLSQQVHQYDGNHSIANEALRLASSAVTLQPNLSQAHKAKGFALDISDQDNKAIESYQKAIKLDSNNVGALLNKAILHWEASNYISAYILIKKVIALDPLDFFGYLLKAEILTGANDFERAQPIFDKLFVHHPNSMIIAQGRAQFYFDQGKYKLAIEASKALLHIMPSYTSAKILLADSLLFSGLWLEANSHYLTISKLAPSWEVDYAKLRLHLIKANRAGEAFNAQILFEQGRAVNQLESNVNLLLLANYIPSKRETSFRILNRLIELDRINIKWLEDDPHLKQLRQNVQFKRLKEKLINKKYSFRKKLRNNDGF